MRLVYNVYDDENQIESKQFDNFPDALEYAKQGLITYICEEDLDCPGCEERVVWTWDSTWDDEEAIAEVTAGRENVDLFNEVNSFDRANPVSEGPALSEDIEINISGPVEEVRDLASFIFGDEFDLEWDTPIEEVKVDEQDFSDEFGYEDEPAVRDLDFDADDPFDDDLYYSEDEFEDDDELEDEEIEIGEPEIIETPKEKFDDSELAMSDEDIEKVNEPFKETEPNGEEVVKDNDKKVELTEGTGFFSLFDDSAEKLFLEKWADILNDHLRNRINLLRLRVKRPSGSGSNVYYNKDYLTDFRILNSEVWTYGTEPKLIFKLAAVKLDEKNLRITKPYTEISLNILLDDLAAVDKATGAVKPKSRIAASKNYDLDCKWDYTSIEFTKWTSKPFRDLLTQLVEEQKELKQSTDGRNTKIKAAKKLAQFSQEEINIAKNWFKDHVEKIEFNVVSGSPRSISNDDFDIEREQIHTINKIHIENIDDAIEEAILERQKKFLDDYNIKHITPSLDHEGTNIKIGTNIYLNWRRADEEVQSHLPYYITEFFNTCKIYFDTKIGNAPEEVINILTDAVYGSNRTERALDKSKYSLQNNLAGEMIINQLFNSDLNFLSDRLAASFDRKSKTVITEENKLATNKRGDYLIAADSGKGYTVFSRNDVRIGGFDGEDDQKAIDKFNKGEFKESLKESLNLPTMRASEIKAELDLHGDIYFDLLEPVDESDEDGWRGASEVRIVDTGSEYEVYFEWLDQDGDYIESDPEFTCGTFEELLTEIDGFYVTVVDLEEYSDSDLDEAIKMTKDELLDKEGTTDVNLINAGRSEEDRVELEEGRQPVYSHVIFYYYDENNNENTITKTNLVPKDIRAEVDNLIKCGATRVYVDAKINGEWEPLDKYTYDPVWTPGTPEYAARNGKDFALAVESLDQEDDLTDQEFAEQFKQKLEEIKK